MINKSGQFFIVFAVLFGFLLLGITTFYNYVNIPSFDSQRFYQSCDNYESEINRISKMSARGEISNEFNSIESFTDSFVTYHRNNDNNISLLLRYKSESGTPGTIDESQGEILETETKTLNNHEFYYIIQLKKGEEVFRCFKK